MRSLLFICAASGLLAVTPPALADDEAVSEGVFAVAGTCVWSGQRRESALTTAFIAEIATNLVQSFATALQAAAAGRTRTNSATLVLDPERHECIQFVRGALSVTATQADTAAALVDYLRGTPDGAAALYANGVRLNSAPGLIIEVRLHTIREASDGRRLIVLEPSFIGYREPSFRQALRFWDGNERTFGLQLQLDQAPNAPAAIASGGQLQLGTRRPSHERLHIDMGNAGGEGIPSPGSSLAFQVQTGDLYNARVSVAESSSTSAFMTFWANVIAAPSVQSAAAGELQDALSEDRRDAAERNAYESYATRRSELGTLVNECPGANNQSARAWVMTERAKLVQAIRDYTNAAGDADVPTAAFPALSEEAGTAEIVAWCASTRDFLQQH